MAGFAPRDAERQRELDELGRPELHRYSHSFIDPAMEKAFQEHDFTEHFLPTFKTTILAATLTFAAFGIVDWFSAPEARTIAMAMRYGVIIPTFIAMTVAGFMGRLRQAMPLVKWGALLLPQITHLSIGAAATLPISALHQLFPIYFLLLVPWIVRASVFETFISTGLTTIGLAAMYMMVDTPVRVAAFVMGAYLVTWGWTTFTMRQWAYSNRHSYFQSQVIAWQFDELHEEREKSERLLLNVLPRSIAHRLKSNPGAIADQYNNVSVLFADIVGFTSYAAEVSASALVTRLNTIFSRFDNLADRYHLEKIKTIGDCYMVAGGLPEQHDAHADAVVDMGLSMIDELERLNEGASQPLQMRIGVHSGPVVAGVIGERKFIYDLWGDTVNTASRMESHGAAGKLQVSEATSKLLSERFELESRGKIKIKGRGEMATYFVTRKAADER